MFESLVITLREGVEAALVLAIALALLRRRGLERLSGALFAGAGLALAASIGVAFLATRITWNEELAEGAAMLIGAVLVLTLVWWMWRAAPRMKEEIEAGIARVTGGDGAGGGSWPGLFLFAFGMVFREGVETAVFLSAAGFNSQGLGRWLGALAGVVLAIAFGVLFVRGTLKVPLKPFFSLTSAVLLLLAAQLLIGGLHELSEGQVLPSSRVEMAIVGPVVKNELLLFTLTVALAAGWLLFGPGRQAQAAPAATEGPEARLARARVLRDRRRRRWTGIVALIVVSFLTTAFVRESRLPGKGPATALAFDQGVAKIADSDLADGKLHFYQVQVPGNEQPVRLFAVRVGGKVQTCFDACEICGDKGYFQDGGTVVCRNCTSPIALTSLGRTGGCNPIPLVHNDIAGVVTIDQAEIARALPHLKGH